MTATTLRFAPTLALPVEAVTQRFGFLGRIGSGKSYAATKLAELMHAIGAQFVAVDPVGVWYGLRVDGKGKGLNIPIFGGLHGDVPLEAGGGALMADLVVDRRLSCVLDVSQFESDRDKARFAGDFAKRFFFRKKAAPSAVHLFLEECQEFVPQNPQRGEEMMLHEFTRMAKLGRNFGIGISLITQRPQEVNKKVLNLTECLFAFQMTGTHERKAIKEWVSAKGADDRILDILPTLAVGVAHVYSPQWLRISEQAKSYEKRSADVSSTPQVDVDATPIATKPLDAKELAALHGEMAATIEKAKQDDPRELRKRIAILEREKARTVPAEPIINQAAVDEAYQAGIDDERRTADGRWREAVAAMGAALEQELLASARATVEAIETKVAALRVQWSEDRTSGATPPKERVGGRTAQRPLPPRLPAPLPERVVRRMAVRDDARVLNADANGTIGKGERIILIAIAQHGENGVTREQLTVLTGYKRSSRDTYLQRLKAQGYIEEASSASLFATPEGVNVLGADYEPLPTGAALGDYWLNRLTAGEKLILGELIDAGKGTRITRDDLSEKTGYQRSSRDTYIQRLSARKLAVTDRDGVGAAPILFD